MEIHVDYFGLLRELTGTHRETVHLAEGGTVRQLLTILAQQRPVLHQWLLMGDEPSPSLLVAVDDLQATATTTLNDGANVVLLPPVSGGQ